MRGWQIENCVTIVATVALVLGALALGAGAHSFWGLLILLNINSPAGAKK